MVTGPSFTKLISRFEFSGIFQPFLSSFFLLELKFSFNIILQFNEVNVKSNKNKRVNNNILLLSILK